MRAGNQKPQRGGHRAEIGSDVDNVGDEKQRDERVDEGHRIVPAHIAGQPAPGNPANLRANDLNRTHQRIGEEKRPPQRVAKLSASLRVSRNSAWIIVRRAGDEARTEDVGELRPVRLIGGCCESDLGAARRDRTRTQIERQWDTNVPRPWNFL